MNISVREQLLFFVKKEVRRPLEKLEIQSCIGTSFGFYVLVFCPLRQKNYFYRAFLLKETVENYFSREKLSSSPIVMPKISALPELSSIT